MANYNSPGYPTVSDPEKGVENVEIFRTRGQPGFVEGESNASTQLPEGEVIVTSQRAQNTKPLSSRITSPVDVSALTASARQKIVNVPKIVSSPASTVISPKGTNKLIDSINAFIIKAQVKVNQILYGRYRLPGDTTVKGPALVIDRGVVGMLREVATIDYCNLFSYLITSTGPIRSNFDPQKPPQQSGFAKDLWSFQKLAYDTEKIIAKYYASYGSFAGQDSRVGLLELTRQINVSIDALANSTSILSDKEIRKLFSVDPFINYIRGAQQDFNSYANSLAIPTGDVEKIQKIIEQIQSFLGLIQRIPSLDPAAIASAIDRIVGAKLQQDVQKANKWFVSGNDGRGVRKIIASINNVLQQTKNINRIAQNTLNYIRLAQLFVKIILILIRVFTLIRRFLGANPAPAAAAPVGGLAIYADVTVAMKTIIIQKNTETLKSLNTTLGLIYSFVVGLVAAINEMLGYLRLIALNLQNCYPEITQEIENTIAESEKSIQELTKFVNQLDSESNRKQNSFGDYTIEIRTEEVTDEGISLKRRYGVAISNRNQITVESTPTFASLDLIIINEVKALLVSKGLVDIGVSGVSTNEAQIILDSLTLLGEDQIVFEDTLLQNITIESVDPDISSFFDNLPGGKALRKKIRNKIIARNQQLAKDLKTEDPNSKFSSSIVKQMTKSI